MSLGDSFAESGDGLVGANPRSSGLGPSEALPLVARPRTAVGEGVSLEPKPPEQRRFRFEGEALPLPWGRHEMPVQLWERVRSSAFRQQLIWDGCWPD